ncbi:uncharacterized protein UV8b_01054 [Ustilaginoidea virens]|uniref:Electron transfer flavoprotein alpha-subunit n=1 Tax=Ustilaginoidea virens TaxID=1159556 RepID=A0A1B5L8F4_USTVR|nr:uncharacterized protein UV8b_01054 [Ustilaginoidea virens]QUC16813.1 hypothetical protein UV8b_01054 [Ustilaginoidea virens]GAO19994.1 hypothetical protein UVI_02053350 [Ustilaginoidea virens]
MAPSKQVVASAPNAVASIDPDQTLKASKALLAHIRKAAKQKAQEATKRNLLDDAQDGDGDDSPVWLTLTTKRHIADKARLQPGKIPVPHSLHADQTSTICAITADPQRAYKNIIGSADFPAGLAKRITRVIDFGKLKAKYGQYDAQRKLFSEHDIFLADDRIITRLPKVLGKTFYKTTAKRPIPVVLSAKRPRVDGKRVKREAKGPGDAVNAGTPADIAREIERALSSALVSLSPTTNTAIRVGYASWTPEQIADNVDAVATGLVGKWVPQKWRNVRSIYIKGPETAALPIWLTDELWLDEQDVVPDAVQDGAEKANVGKKRKSLGDAADADAAAADAAAAAAPKKKAKKAEAVAESNDDKLEKQIAERKAKLKKQKAAAKKAMD